MVRFKRYSRFVAATLFGALAGLGTTSAFAQNAEVARVRGEVVSFDGQATLVVKSRQGTNVTVHLGEPLRLVGVVKASVSDIKPGVFIGTTTVQKDGSASRSLEIHIFHESLRGTGEGDRPWDLVPGSSMTNGTAGSAVDSVDGKTITVSYQGGSRTVVIQPDTAIVTYVPADKSEIKPGAKVFSITQKAADGTLTASVLSVGKDGVTPPM
jgi:hypothetical protein